MAGYSFSEQTDMLLMLGECFGNANAAVRRYAEMFPARRVPNSRTILRIVQRLRETGCLKTKNRNGGRPRSARTVEVEEEVLNIVEQDPEISTRKLARRIDTTQANVARILKEQQLHPYHYLQVQELLPRDNEIRVRFCEELLERTRRCPDFLNKILFTDEATFTRNGVFNSRNTHFWADENPHVVKVTHFQYNFKVNVWAATLGNKFVGYYMFPGSLNGAMYLNFLENELDTILEDIPLNIRREICFMHDGAPPHYVRVVRDWLNDNFPNRWIGRGIDAPISWPARSPDLNPLDFSIWGYMKSRVYATEIRNVEELRQKIVNECTLLKNDHQTMNGLMNNLRKRLRICITENGGHFEQLI